MISTESPEELAKIKFDPSNLTAGQRWVGVSFNPSQNISVAEMKEKMAEATDILEQWVARIDRALTPDEQIIYQSAKADILRGQMLAVKLFTFNPSAA